MKYKGSLLAVLLRPLGGMLAFFAGPVMFIELAKETITGKVFGITETIFVILYFLVLIVMVAVLPGLGLLKLADVLNKRAVEKSYRKKFKKNKSKAENGNKK